MQWIRHPKDFWAGVLFIAFGTAADHARRRLPARHRGADGPGLLPPRARACCSIGLGLILALRALKLTGAPLGDAQRQAAAHRAGAACWSSDSTATRLGVVAATMLLILISSTADREYRWKEALISSLVLAALTVAAFIWGLGVQLPVWPPFLTGR